MINPPEICVICLSGFTLFTETDHENLQVWSRRVRTRCQHIFHLKCIRLWVHVNNICPICQSPDPLFSVVRQMGPWTLDHISPAADVVLQHPDFRQALKDIVSEEAFRVVILSDYLRYISVNGIPIDIEKYISHYTIPLHFLDN